MTEKCPHCGNEDRLLFGKKNGELYCRKCISFNGSPANLKTKGEHKKIVVRINYKLSSKQEAIAFQLLENYKKGIPTLVHAVCGAGKTEIVYSLIAHVISNGGTVGFAIPRRDVVIELYERLNTVFSDCQVIAVYGGHNDVLIGDLVVLTTHQLYRYKHSFTLLIVDEIDAFPFKNNDVLRFFADNSYLKSYVFMSATPSEEVTTHFSKPGRAILRLMSRYHGGRLPVPIIKLTGAFLAAWTIVLLVRQYIARHKPVFIFCPTIKLCTGLFSFLKIFIKKGGCVHSKVPSRARIIDEFKKGNLMYLVTTSVLERGVTIKNLQVIIYQAHHELYDEATLVQIAGRVGRKSEATTGDVIFFAHQKTTAMENAIKQINAANLHL